MGSFTMSNGPEKRYSLTMPGATNGLPLTATSSCKAEIHRVHPDHQPGEPAWHLIPRKQPHHPCVYAATVGAVAGVGCATGYFPRECPGA